MTESEKPWRNQGVLEELYIEDNLTSVEIAEELGCTTPTVCKWLKKYSIEVKSNSEIQYDELADEDWLRQKHINEDKPANEIADIIGCSESTVCYWINKHEIENRASAPKDEERLRELYWEEYLTLSEIGDEINRSKETLRRWFDELGIKRREREFLAKKPDLDVLEREYKVEMKNTIELAQKYDVSDATIGNWLRENGVELRYGGFEPKEDKPFLEKRRQNRYGDNWKSQRELARKRDNFKCRSCGSKEADLDRQLDVHHIRPLSEFYSETDDEMDYESANQLHNLISLCRTCHMKYEKLPIAPVKGE